MKYLGNSSRYGMLAGLSALLFLCVDVPGQWGPDLQDNALCFRYLGCNAGFGGYDALCHFLFGIAFALGIYWFCRRWPRYSILHEQYWKGALVTLALVGLFAAVWECLEFTFDILAVIDLHHPLTHLQELQFLAQPTNADTVGDMFYGMLGAICGIIVLAFV